MSIEEKYGIPPGSVSCGYCEKQVATAEHIHECARRVESMRHYLMTVRLGAARKVIRALIADLMEVARMAKHNENEGLVVATLAKVEWLNANYDDAALRRIVEEGE